MVPPYNPFDNPDFRAELSKMLDEKLTPLAALQAKVDEHDRTIERMKGGLAVINLLWMLIIGVVEWFVHRR